MGVKLHEIIEAHELLGVIARSLKKPKEGTRFEIEGHQGVLIEPEGLVYLAGGLESVREVLLRLVPNSEVRVGEPLPEEALPTDQDSDPHQ